MALYFTVSVYREIDVPVDGSGNRGLVSAFLGNVTALEFELVQNLE